MFTSRTHTTICADCGGNGFKWLDIPNLITQNCKTCNNTGEIKKEIHQLEEKDNYVNQRAV